MAVRRAQQEGGGSAVDAFLASIQESLHAVKRSRSRASASSRSRPRRADGREPAEPEPAGADPRVARAEVLGGQPAQDRPSSRVRLDGDPRTTVFVEGLGDRPGVHACLDRVALSGTGSPRRSSASEVRSSSGSIPRPRPVPVEVRDDVTRVLLSGIIDAVAPHAVAVKPQLAFFEALGVGGHAPRSRRCAPTPEPPACSCSSTASAGTSARPLAPTRPRTSSPGPKARRLGRRAHRQPVPRARLGRALPRRLPAA